MSFEFKHIDDYEIIISREGQKSGNDFRALIDSKFEDDDLVFCLLEMVTLSDIDAIGETYIYSCLSKSEGRELLQKYVSVVKKVQSRFDFALSEFLDWYKKNTFILLRKNQVNFTYPYPNPNWEQEPGSQEGKRDRSIFGKQITNSLRDQDIQEYLQYYATMLHEELNLKQFPNYCIIVRPISVAEGQDVIPLGNLYLHFATMTERDHHFYFRLLNDYLIVWFKRKGVKLIKEIKFQTLLDIEEKKENKDYLPNFEFLHKSANSRLQRKLKPCNKSLEDYFDAVFLNDERRKLVDKKFDILNNKLIIQFIDLKSHLSNRDEDYIPRFSELKDQIDCKGKLFGIQGQSVLKAEYNIDHFIKVLLRRQFFYIGFLVFDIDKNLLRNLLAGKGIALDHQSDEADYQALWTEMFIPWSKSGDKEKSKELIFSSLSEFESKYLDSCKSNLIALE